MGLETVALVKREDREEKLMVVVVAGNPAEETVDGLGLARN